MINEDSTNHGRHGRYLTPLENDALNMYDQLLKKYKVKGYDRISVHRAFPDISAAYQKFEELRTYYTLNGGVQESDYEGTNERYKC